MVYSFLPNFALIIIYCHPCEAKKCLSTAVFNQIFNFAGSVPCSLPPPIRAKFGMREYTRSLRLLAKFHPDHLIVSPMRGETPKFYRFFNFSVVWWRHLAVQTRMQTTHLPLSNITKIVCEFKRLYANLAFTNFTKLYHLKAWQTSKNTTFSAPGVATKPCPSILGMAIVEVHIILAPQKRFHIWRIVLPLGGALKILGKMHIRDYTPEPLQQIPQI